MTGIQDYDCPQESVLIDTHEGYVSSDRKKTRKRKIARFINLLLNHFHWDKAIFHCINQVNSDRAVAVGQNTCDL